MTCARRGSAGRAAAAAWAGCPARAWPCWLREPCWLVWATAGARDAAGEMDVKVLVTASRATNHNLAIGILSSSAISAPRRVGVTHQGARRADVLALV